MIMRLASLDLPTKGNHNTQTKQALNCVAKRSSRDNKAFNDPLMPSLKDRLSALLNALHCSIHSKDNAMLNPNFYVATGINSTELSPYTVTVALGGLHFVVKETNNLTRYSQYYYVSRTCEIQEDLPELINAYVPIQALKAIDYFLLSS